MINKKKQNKTKTEEIFVRRKKTIKKFFIFVYNIFSHQRGGGVF